MSNIDIIQAIIGILLLGLHAGITYNKLENLKAELDSSKKEFDETCKEMQKEIDALKLNHQTIQLTIVNSPTKEDIKNLSTEVQSLKMTLVRLEVILEHLAQQNGVTLKEPRHGDT